MAASSASAPAAPAAAIASPSNGVGGRNIAHLLVVVDFGVGGSLTAHQCQAWKQVLAQLNHTLESLTFGKHRSTKVTLQPQCVCVCSTASLSHCFLLPPGAQRRAALVCITDARSAPSPLARDWPAWHPSLAHTCASGIQPLQQWIDVRPLATHPAPIPLTRNAPPPNSWCTRAKPKLKSLKRLARYVRALHDAWLLLRLVQLKPSPN